jgi:hypothetical protein
LGNILQSGRSDSQLPVLALETLHWKKRSYTKPKKGFVGATKLLKDFENWNEF